MQENLLKTRFGNNDLILQTGKLAKQAGGSVVVQYGGTVVLVTACMSKEIREGRDFFPLTVEYQEKTYAAGRIPGGFFKREGRPSESEILAARLIDRPIRPLFPKGFLNDVQVIALVLSSDGENDPDVLAVNGASIALSISEIPFNGPLACCRVGRVNKELILNPTYAQLDAADLDVVVAANRNGIVMLESRANDIPEEDYLAAVKFAYESLNSIIELQEQFRKVCGKEKAKVEFFTVDDALKAKVDGLAKDKLKEIYKLSKKEDREEAVAILSKELEAVLAPEGYEAPKVKAALVDIEQAEVRSSILSGRRIDGRAMKDIRPITAEVSVLPRTHGSS